MSAGSPTVAALVRAELTRPPPEAAARMAAAIAAALGDATASVVFYGSCLRKQTAEGVLDFYAVVDDYGRAGLARWSHRLPPSVLWIECEGPGGETLRSKYAVVTAEDFRRGVAPDVWRTGFWARFCQPALVAWRRDAAALDTLVEVCERAVLTAVESIAPLLEAPAGSDEFWRRVFAETYAREMRTESATTIAGIQAAAPDRFARVLREALLALDARGDFPVRWEGERFALALPAAELAARRRRWRRRRPLAKAVYVGQLVKTAFLQTDWLPYALWKLERHTGKPIPYTERQRRHPFVFGWPLLYRVLRDRQLR